MTSRFLTSTISFVAALPLAAVPASASPTPNSADAWLERTLSRMTLEEKVGQMFVTYAYGPSAGAAHPKNREEFGVDTPADVVHRYHLGGVIHFGWTDSLHEPRQIAALSNGLQRASLDSGAKVPLLISTDQEQGSVTRVGPPATQFPGSMALGAGRSSGDAGSAASITGQEMRAIGLNQNFAPSADVNVNPANPIIGVRSFASDPTLAADLTGAQVRGFQESVLPPRSVSSAAKHFPGHGDTSQDSHTSLPVIEHTREQWERLDAPPFRAAIAAGVDSVMTAHIVMPKLDPSGEPATLSPAVLTGMLREELGYRGVIVTDSLQMQGVREKHPDPEIPVLAIQAGADQMLMPNDLRAAIDGVLEAVRTGRISEQRIDESVRRILRMKQQRGVIDHPLVDESAVDSVVGADQHRAESQRMTDRTTTLLRNDVGVLPLHQKPSNVLVTGSGQDNTTTLANELRARGPATTALPTGSNPTDADIERAVGEAKRNQLAVVLTSAAWTPDNAQQLKLVRALRDTGVPLVAVAVRDPYDAAHVDEVSTWLATYSTAPVAMRSLAKTLFGEIQPSGKLPVPVPDPNRPGAERYPFGHGLSW